MSSAKHRKPNGSAQTTPSRMVRKCHLRTLLHDREKQLASCERELKVTLEIMHIRDVTIARMDAEKLALELGLLANAHERLNEMMTTKLGKAEYEVAVREYWNDSGDEVKELCEESKAQWQRANDAEQRMQRLEHDLPCPCQLRATGAAQRR